MEYSKKDIYILRHNSIERVFNTAIKLAKYAMNSTDPNISELGGISLDDLTDFKDITVRLWNNARNETWEK